jgi:hypothetical protein
VVAEVGVADIIGFPGKELTACERKRLEEFMVAEMADIEDTSCDAYDEIQNEIIILAEYFRRFMAVVEDPDTKMNHDLDFSLFLLEGRIRKIRGMIKSLSRKESAE